MYILVIVPTRGKNPVYDVPSEPNTPTNGSKRPVGDVLDATSIEQARKQIASR